MIDQLKQLLVIQEGLRLDPYLDTVGKLTIGVGRNLDDRGISYEEAMYLLDNDINDLMEKLPLIYSWYPGLSDVRKIVIISMAFNLGLKKFSEFKNFRTALMENKFNLAAQEMLNSKWARQVGRRARTLATMMVSDELPENLH